MTVIFKNIDDESLYEQLVSRIYHVERAFIVRRHIKLHYAKVMPKGVVRAYTKVRSNYAEFFATFEESLLWFMTIELWSRFTANSDRGLRKLVLAVDDETVKQKYTAFVERHKDVIGYISTQRLRYLAHADGGVEWKDFPNIWDNEYETLINDIKSLLTVIGETTGSQRRPTDTSEPEEDTCRLFDDLLSVASPKLDISKVSEEYSAGVKSFLHD